MTTSKIALLKMMFVLALLLPDAAQGYYHPGKGRWLSRDPLGEHFSRNLYCGMENDVPNKLDALGQFSVQPIMPVVSEPCGFFQVNWTFDLEFRAESSGWIVQEVMHSVSIEDCDKPPVVINTNYKYEMFRVAPNESVPAVQARGGVDQFQSTRHPNNTKGTHTISAKAWFFYDPPGRSLATGWPGGTTENGDFAPPTDIRPAWLDTLDFCAGVLTHTASVEWNCCCSAWQTLGISPGL